MDVLDGKIIFRQFIALADILRQVLPLQPAKGKSLGNGLCNGFISQAPGLSVYGLHGRNQPAIVFFGKYLRLFHGKASTPAHNAAAEYVRHPRF